MEEGCGSAMEGHVCSMLREGQSWRVHSEVGWFASTTVTSLHSYFTKVLLVAM